jgi:hypothetical protein
MKIALCLHGYFENTGGFAAGVKASQYLKKKLLSRYEVDVFVHSWDLKNKQAILDLYKPVEYIFEEQKDFSEELKKFDQEWFFGQDGKAPGMYSINTLFKTLSFLYSRKKSVEIKTNHEKKHNFSYDCVILARFDLGQRGKEYPQVYYATDFNFNPLLNMDFLYSAFWNQLNHGFADHWFYSNSKNINIVSQLYDKVFDYYQKDSAYVNSVLNGWIDSSQKHEFSNEFLKEIKDTKLKKFEKWACIDNHKLYKWYFYDCDLYKKCKFIDITQDL